MTREAKQEIRRVLMGRTLIAEDGRLVAMEKGRMRMPMGISDGAGAVRFLGIRKKACCLKVSCSEEKARSLARQRMEEIGRGLYLLQQPEAPACLIRYVLTRPAVLVFDFQEGLPVLTAWAGRGLTGWISNRRALKDFLQKLPKQMALSEEPVPRDETGKKKKKDKEDGREARKSRKERKRRKGQAEQADPGATDINTEGNNE